MELTATRRDLLRLLGAMPLLACGGGFAAAREGSLIGRLIAEAQDKRTIADRIDFISRSLIGVRYQANTLIGGPHRKEVFVIREDAFDCVTFCEVVLAAARSRDLAEFEAALLKIRYEHDRVTWDERNHYFGQWSQSAVEKGICERVEMQPSQTIQKSVQWGPVKRRTVSLAAIPAATMMANQRMLAAGDVIGFVSRRANLDFYHTGLLAFRSDGTLLLRHASQSRRRILDERMADFVAHNRVRYVTLLRPLEPTNLAKS
jgi:hypothetical protein